MTIQELETRLRAAKARNDRQAIATLEHQLTIAKAEAARLEVEAQARGLVDRLREAFAAGAGLAVGLVVDSFTDRIGEWFLDKLVGVATSARESHIENLLRGANPPQMRSILGLPIGSQGEILPEPARMPADLRDEGLSQREIVEHISGLVTVPGDPTETRRTPPREILRSRLDRLVPLQAVVRSSRPDVSAAFESKLDYHAEQLKRRLASAQARLQVIDDPREWQKRFDDEVMVSLGLKKNQSGPVGYARDIALELRHEAARVKEQVKDADAAAIAAGVEVGYTLFSRFMENTRPHHAANDGLRFYRDNRTGSADIWEKRIVPPYAKNCVCFTVPIMDTPDGDEFSAAFDIRTSRGDKITVRDVGSFHRWFDRQRPGIQQKLIGPKLWAAVNEKGTRPTYADFFRPNGTPLKLTELEAESPRDLQRRRARTQVIFDTQERRHRGSWDEPGWLNRFSSEPKLEAEYRRRLRGYLKKLEGTPKRKRSSKPKYKIDTGPIQLDKYPVKIVPGDSAPATQFRIDGARQEFEARINEAPPEVRGAVRAMLEDRPISAMKVGNGYYHPQEEYVSADPFGLTSRNKRVTIHELGHAIDHWLAKKKHPREPYGKLNSMLDEWQLALIEDVDRLDMEPGVEGRLKKAKEILRDIVPKEVPVDADDPAYRSWLEESGWPDWNMVTDTIDALTKGVVLENGLGSGHGERYYQIPGYRGVEIFAQFFTALGLPEQTKALHKIAPAQGKIFLRLLNEILEGEYS